MIIYINNYDVTIEALPTPIITLLLLLLLVIGSGVTDLLPFLLIQASTDVVSTSTSFTSRYNICLHNCSVYNDILNL